MYKVPISSSTSSLVVPIWFYKLFIKDNFVLSAGVPVAFKIWCGHQYRVGIIAPPPWLR